MAVFSWTKNVIDSFTDSTNCAETCVRLLKDNKERQVICPQLFQHSENIWCCQSNTFNAHCCKWSEKSKTEQKDQKIKRIRINLIPPTLTIYNLTINLFLALFIVLLIPTIIILVSCYLARYFLIKNNRTKNQQPSVTQCPLMENFLEDKPPSYDSALSNHSNRKSNIIHQLPFNPDFPFVP